MTSTSTVHNHLLSDASGEQGYYTGPVMEKSTKTTSGTSKNKNNSNNSSPLLPHGKNGDFRYENGRRYKGDWNKGRWHGIGQAWFTNGDSYEGSYVNDQRHGRGLYRWRDGRIYEGDFANDLRHGQGRYHWLDGTTYQGSFEKGQQKGKGVCTFKGGKYTGEFDRGQYHGYGECIYDDGRTYKGEWRNGMAHGRGVETDRDGTIIHQGEWRDDEPDVFRGESNSVATNDSEVSEMEEQQQLKPVVSMVVADSRGRKGTFRGMLLRGIPHNVGHMVYDSGDIATYQGFWDYGDWKKGRVEYRNGDIFDGDFENNLRCGLGRYDWADGRQYQGEWKADRREGQGRFHFPNGDVYEGHFVAGQRHGFGRFEFHDNSLFEGSFQKGEFHGQGCKFVHKDGRVYLGDFSEGARHGFGKEVYPNGSLRYEGEWIQDEPLFSGKIKPPPEGFVLMDGDDDGQLENVSITSKKSTLSSIYADTKDCKTVVEETIKDASGTEGKYTGLVLNGLPHGVGRMVYSCEIREGFWKHGHLDGHARAFFQTGDFYEGMFVNSVREGKGVYKWSDGRVYEGDYINDQRHGHGRFVYPTGDEYVGGYEKGMRCGKGKFTFFDGSSYDGEWQDSVYHGYGELKEINESYYKGGWKQGRKHGKGVQYEAEHSLLIHGEWDEGELVKEINVPEESKVKDPEQPLAVHESEAGTSELDWGLLDGEHRRWEPTEKGKVEELMDNNDLEDVNFQAIDLSAADDDVQNDHDLESDTADVPGDSIDENAEASLVEREDAEQGNGDECKNVVVPDSFEGLVEI